MNPKALRASSTRLAPAYIAWPTRLDKKDLDGPKITPYLVTYPHCKEIDMVYATLELIFVAMIAVVIATHAIPALI